MSIQPSAQPSGDKPSNNNQPSQPQPTPTATAMITAQTNAAGGSSVGPPQGGGPMNTAMPPSNGAPSNATQSVPQNNANPFLGKPTYASYSNDIPPAYLTWKKTHS